MQRMRSIHESAAVKSAIELGVFTKLGALCRRGYGIGRRPGNARETRAGATAAEVAAACECSERGMRVLLDSLASARFLRKRSRVQVRWLVGGRGGVREFGDTERSFRWGR